MTTLVFRSGDHLRVHRGLYWHHGIYVGDDRVIEFGGGSRFRKWEIGIREIELKDFVRIGRVEVVRHPAELLPGLGIRLPKALPAEQVVHRAQWLEQQPLPVGYNLVGSNCEHIANWCVTGGYFESLQVRRAFRITAFIVGPGLLLVYRYVPALRRHPLCLAVVGVGGLAGPVLYNVVPNRTWKDVLDAYPGYPSSGSTGCTPEEGADS
jgi:hypothetical protein